MTDNTESNKVLFRLWEEVKRNVEYTGTLDKICIDHQKDGMIYMNVWVKPTKEEKA